MAISLLYGPATQAEPGVPATITVAIPEQPLSQALADFARQTDLQLVYESEVVRNRSSNTAPAGLSPGKTLEHLLKGTGLKFEFLNARTVVIRKNERAVLQPTESAPVQEVIVTASILRERSDTTPVSQVVWTSDAMAVPIHWCFHSSPVARGLCGSQKYTFTSVASEKSLWLAISLPRSQVNERRTVAALADPK
jgi:hypothetical protein